jgi:hypothetical protein
VTSSVSACGALAHDIAWAAPVVLAVASLLSRRSATGRADDRVD